MGRVLPFTALERRRFAARVKKLRARYGWTHEQFAAESGVERRTVMKMERTDRGLQAVTVLKVKRLEERLREEKAAKRVGKQAVVPRWEGHTPDEEFERLKGL